MPSFIKKVFVGIMFLSLALVMIPKQKVEAEVSPAKSAEQSIKDFYEAFPEVYIDDIVLPQKEYKAGDTITGSFLVRNAKNFDVSDISCEIVLVGDYDESNLAQAFYGVESQSPFSLKAEEGKKFDFSYKIPEALNGTDFGIQVRTLLRGDMQLSWKDAFIKVTGGKPALSVSSIYISANKKAYGLQIGPTFKKGANASLNALIKNPNSSDLTATPVIKIEEYIASSTPISIKTNEISVGKKASKEISIDLPTNIDPAVYEGTVYFANKEGIKVTPTFEFRYIVGGDIVNFQSVSANKTVLKIGEKFNISLFYSGSPIDIDNFDVENIKQNPNITGLSIKIFNEKDEVVAKNVNPKFDFNYNNNLSLPLIASVSSKALRAEIVASKNGNIVAQYNANLSSDYAKVKEKAQKESETMKILTISLMAILLIAVIFIVKKLKNRNSVATMMLMLLIGLSVFVGSQKAEAFTVDSATIHNSRDYLLVGAKEVGISSNLMNISISTPSLNGYLASGEEFNPSGSLIYLACGNATFMRVEITAKYKGNTLPTKTIKTSVEDIVTGGGGHPWFTLSNNFSIGDASNKFKVTDAPGTDASVSFIIKLIRMDSGGDDEPWITLTGHQDFKVMPKPFPVISATPNPSTNGTTKVTWKIPNNSGNQTITGSYCTASGDWSGTKTYSSVLQGENVTGITSPKTYSIKCFKMFHGISIPSDKESVTVNFAPTTGSVKIKTVDANKSLVSSTAVLDGTTQKTDNPATFATVSVGGHTSGILQGSHTNITAGQCVYPVGGTECADPTVFNINPTCSGSPVVCSVPSNVVAGNVVKTVFLIGSNSAVDLTATPSTLLSCGSFTTLKWISSGVTSCTGTGFNASGKINNSIGVSVTPASPSSTYSISCTTSTGSTVSDSVTVPCGSSPEPTVNIVADPVSVSSGGASILKWTSTNATSCTGPGSLNSTNTTSNTAGVSTGSLTVTTPFTITCTGPGGEAQDTATVEVGNLSGSLEVRRVDSSFSSFTTETETWYDTTARVTTNSAIFAPVSVGNHTVNVSVPLGYKMVGVASCNTKDCVMESLSDYKNTFSCVGTTCSYTANVSNDTLTRVAFMYSPANMSAALSAKPSSGNPPLTSNLTAVVSGSLLAKKTSQVAGAGLTVTSPTLVYTFSCGNGTAASPASLTTTNTTAGSSCTYNAEGIYTAEVTVTGNGQTASGGVEIKVGAVSGTEEITPDPTLVSGTCQPTSISGTAIESVKVGERMMWSLNSYSYDPDASYVFKDSSTGVILGDFIPNLGADSIYVTKVYTTTGEKHVTLTTVKTINGEEVVSPTIPDCGLLTGGKVFKVIADPNFIEF